MAACAKLIRPPFSPARTAAPSTQRVVAPPAGARSAADILRDVLSRLREQGPWCPGIVRWRGRRRRCYRPPMCGKFTAQASWREVVAFSQPLTDRGGDPGDSGGDEGGGDGIVTYRVGAAVPVIVWDAEAGVRRVAAMRWGFPDPRDWRRPRPIHARSETVDSKEPFRAPFHAGQRGIVVFRTFNEGEEIFKPSGRPQTRQWTIDPRDGRPRGFAFVWRRYAVEGQPAPLPFCVMATVAANDLIRRTVKPQEDDPRMPA
ncbi:MAG: SOS response-associated peptidase family protein, partial [Rhodospirillales bacterium]|nr:SOS response-associated peptidase family protein [Rhodospirillales bacterium]